MSIDQCGAPILLSCQKKHLNLGRCVLQFPVKDPYKIHPSNWPVHPGSQSSVMSTKKIQVGQMQEPGSPLRVLLDNEMQAAEEPV